MLEVFGSFSLQPAQLQVAEITAAVRAGFSHPFPSDLTARRGTLPISVA